MKKVMVSYIEDIQKCFWSITKVRTDNNSFMVQVQQVFTDIMRRSPRTTEKVEAFISSYQRFASAEQVTLSDPIAKESLYKRVEHLHDFFWKELEAKKDKALAEKEELNRLGKVQAMVEEYIDLYFRVMGCELNKIFYMKEMLA